MARDIVSNVETVIIARTNMFRAPVPPFSVAKHLVAKSYFAMVRYHHDYSGLDAAVDKRQRHPHSDFGVRGKDLLVQQVQQDP